MSGDQHTDHVTIGHIQVDRQQYRETFPKCMRCSMGFTCEEEAARHIKESHPDVITQGGSR